VQAAIKIIKCRVCDNQNLDLVFDAGNQTLTGRFLKSIDEEISVGPLHLVQCNPVVGCGLVQLGHSYDLDEMYGESYGYRSGLNKVMVEHLERKARFILDFAGLKDGDLVIDIGSNDGTTLNAYPSGRYDLVGVDPASKKYGEFYKNEIKRISQFFSRTIIKEHFSQRGAQAVSSFSMFYDLEDPVQFAKDVESVLSDTGVWFLEQSYLPAMLDANSFDTICHEHLEFYTLKSVKMILEKAGIRIIDVAFNDVNGGSFSITACKKYAELDSNISNINCVLEHENSIGLDDGSAFKMFGLRIEKEKKKLMSFLVEQKLNGKKVSCLGASTKGNVLLQYYGISTELVDVVGEVNPDKFGCFTPGTHIPIVSQEDVLAENPDYLLVLPWHFKEFFLTSPVLQGRNLVFPLPQFQVMNRLS